MNFIITSPPHPLLLSGSISLRSKHGKDLCKKKKHEKEKSPGNYKRR